MLIVVSRSKDIFFTRITLENVTLDRVTEIKILGVWLTDDMRWSKNTREICKKPFSRLSLLTKLKFVGVKIEDLIEVYML